MGVDPPDTFRVRHLGEVRAADLIAGLPELLGSEGVPVDELAMELARRCAVLGAGRGSKPAPLLSVAKHLAQQLRQSVDLGDGLVSTEELSTGLITMRDRFCDAKPPGSFKGNDL